MFSSSSQLLMSTLSFHVFCFFNSLSLSSFDGLSVCVLFKTVNCYKLVYCRSILIDGCIIMQFSFVYISKKPNNLLECYLLFCQNDKNN